MSAPAIGSIWRLSGTGPVLARSLACVLAAVLVVPGLPSAAAAATVTRGVGRASGDPVTLAATREALERITKALEAPAEPSLDSQWASLQAVASQAGDPDTDGDAVADSVERVLGLDPDDPDSDRDTLSDSEELIIGTDPRKADSNGDGLTDNAELVGGGLEELAGVGGLTSSAVAVSETGAIIGQRTNDAEEPQTWLLADGVRTVLPVSISEVAAVNSALQVVGKTWTGQAALWTAVDGLTVLPLGMADARASAINEAGTIVGTGSLDDASLPRAWVWDGTSLVWLAMLPGWSTSGAAAVNTSGQVAGSAAVADGAGHAVLWNAGVPMDLGTLGGASSTAAAINDLGQVAGAAETADGSMHAFLWTPGGTMRDLGTLGGRDSWATGVNASGLVVGSAVLENGDEHAVLWVNGVPKDLGAVGGSISAAADISDAGQIVGVGTNATGLRRAVVFNPLGVNATTLAYALSNPDNDGDGVPDEVDSAPFTSSPYVKSTTLTVDTGSDPAYLDFQVVPRTPEGKTDRLTLLDGGAMNWRNGDTGGAMQDRDGSTQDITITPYLELEVADRSLLTSSAVPAYLDASVIDGFARTTATTTGLGAADTGQLWTAAPSGGWFATGGEAHGLPMDATSTATVNLGAVDGYVQARLGPESADGQGVGLTFRFADTENYQYVMVTASRVEVRAVEAGVERLVQGIDHAWSWDRTLRAEFVEDTVTVRWAAQPGYDATWATLISGTISARPARATRVGLLVRKGCDATPSHLCTGAPAAGFLTFEAGERRTALDRYAIMTPTAGTEPSARSVTGIDLLNADADGTADDLRVVAEQQTVFPLPADQVVAGDKDTCIRTTDGGMWCWGDNWWGQLGTGGPGGYISDRGSGVVFDESVGYPEYESWPSGLALPAMEPYPVGRRGQSDALMSGVRTMAAGLLHTCAIAGTPASLYCWGYDGEGAVGRYWLDPGAVLAGTAANPIVAAVTGDGFTCVVDRTSATGPYRIRCQGRNDVGQLGRGTTSATGGLGLVSSQASGTECHDTGRGLTCNPVTYAFVPDPTVSTPSGATGVQIAAGTAHACAIVNVAWSAASPTVYPASGRRAVCWGANDSAQVSAYPDDTASTTAPRLPWFLDDLSTLSLGQQQSCGLSAAGAVLCWGDASPLMGTSVKSVPLASGEAVTKLSVGGNHACVLTSHGRVLCWGDNAEGQLGRGTVGGSSGGVAAVTFPGAIQPRAIEIATGGKHTCAVLDDGRTFCWGANDRGQLGSGPSPSTGTPRVVGGLHSVETVGYDFDAMTSGPATAAAWMPVAKDLHTGTTGTKSAVRPLPAWMPASPAAWPSIGDGLGAPRAIAADIAGNGAPFDVLLWALDEATGELHYRLGTTTADGTPSWSDAEVGGSLAPGKDGHALTLADIDGQPGLDILRIAFDDIASHAVRIQVGSDLGDRAGSLVAQWSDPVRHRGSNPENLLYVPLVPMRNATGEAVAYSGRMFLPDTLGGQPLTAEMRLVWIVMGRTDDPALAEATGDPTARNLTTMLAKYPDAFSLAGFRATAFEDVDMRVLTPDPPVLAATGAVDENARWTAALQGGLVLTERWQNRTGLAAGDDLTLDEAAELPELLEVGLESRSGTFDHEDAALVEGRAMATAALAAVPPGPRVPLLVALEETTRSTDLDDPQHVEFASGRIAVDLATVPAVSTRTFKVNTFDTRGATPVALSGEVVAWLAEVVPNPEVLQALGALLISWQSGKMVAATLDGNPIPGSPSSSGAFDAVHGFLQSAGFEGFMAGKPSIATDALDGLEGEWNGHWRKQLPSVVVMTENADGSWRTMRAAEMVARSERSATMFKSAGDAASGVGATKKVLGAIESLGTYTDVTIAGISFFATWASYGGSYGFAQASVELTITIITTLASWALGAMLAFALGFALESGPAGWIAAGIVTALALGLWAIDEWTGWKWGDALTNALLPLFFKGHEAVHYGTSFVNLRPVLEDTDGNGLDVGDVIGEVADVYVAEYPVGLIKSGLWLVGNTGTWLYDTGNSTIGAGLWAREGTSTLAVPDPTRAADWTGDEVVSRAYDTVSAPHWYDEARHGLGWHDSDSGHDTVVAWVVPAAPDSDFVVSYQVQTAGYLTSVACALGVGCSHEFEGGGSWQEKYVEPSVSHYDVLPATFDGFLEWAGVVTRIDRDGDGLPDADDPAAGEADRDGDHLPDGIEVNDLETDAGVADSDGDGVDDGREVVLGTDPTAVDTDADGLSDGVEVGGWDIAFTLHGQPVQAHVTSDPLRPDSDVGRPGVDGLGDLAEHDAGLNPRSSDTNGDGFIDAPDDDEDGVSNTVEAAAPNDGDGNGDGVADVDQANVASLPAAVDGSFVTVAAPAGLSLESVTTLPADSPERLLMPYGLVDFRLDVPAAGDTSVVTVYVPWASTLADWWKFGPTVDTPEDHWYAFGDGTPGATLADEPLTLDDGTQVAVVTLRLVDGGRGDGDLAANGTIRDPGGPGTWRNAAPTATDDALDVPEVGAMPVDVLGNDADPDGDALAVIAIDDAGTLGSVTVADGVVTYDPAGVFAHLRPDQTATDGFGYTVEDAYGASATARAVITVTGADTPPTLSLSTPSETVQYSDGIRPIKVVATDPDTDALAVSAAGLPAGLALGAVTCTQWPEEPASATGASCTAVIAGLTAAKAGAYAATVIAADEATTQEASLTIQVEAEDAVVRFPISNPPSVNVQKASGASGAFQLSVLVAEPLRDTAPGAAARGDISLAKVSMQLVPVGPGDPVVPSGPCTVRTAGPGLFVHLAVTCPWNRVPVNTYEVAVAVGGGYWTGAGSDALVVHDPKLGSTTGAGRFTWPGTTDPVQFAFTVSAAGKIAKGSFLLVRHAEAGDHVVRSTSVEGLSAGPATGTSPIWASFAGKAAYVGPSWTGATLGHTFTVYVTDGRPEKTDRIWLNVLKLNGAPISDVSLPAPAAGNTVVIDGGDILIP